MQKIHVAESLYGRDPAHRIAPNFSKILVGNRVSSQISIKCCLLSGVAELHDDVSHCLRKAFIANQRGVEILFLSHPVVIGYSHNRPTLKGSKYPVCCGGHRRRRGILRLVFLTEQGPWRLCKDHQKNCHGNRKAASAHSRPPETMAHNYDVAEDLSLI